MKIETITVGRQKKRKICLDPKVVSLYDILSTHSNIQITCFQPMTSRHHIFYYNFNQHSIFLSRVFYLFLLIPFYIHWLKSRQMR